MVSRRQFIEAGAAASVAAALSGAAGIGRGARLGLEHAALDQSTVAASRGGLSRHAARAHLVLIDERFAAARDFGASMRGQGLAVHAIRGDVTDVWYARLHPLWKRTPAPIAGLTAFAAMFCLEHLAWDHGLRMIRYGTEGAGGIDRSLHAWLIAAPTRQAARAV